jgi:SAM-dependent methyltransferase
MTTPLRLPDSRPPATGPEDPLPWYDHPLTGRLFRRRLSLVLSLLDARTVGRVLDVGYGSGLLFPSLRGPGRRLYGVDLHAEGAPVGRWLARSGVETSLLRGDSERLPFADGSFDAVLAVSVIGYARSIGGALREWLRVTREGGIVLLGFPTVNALTAWAMPYCRRRPDPVDHADVLREIRLLGLPVETVRFPAGGPERFALFRACRITRRGSGETR